MWTFLSNPSDNEFFGVLSGDSHRLRLAGRIAAVVRAIAA
jgi:hypothetical protein